MKPSPTRLALLVSLIGLSLSCNDRAMAEEEIAPDAAEKPAAPSADWALGLQGERPTPSMRDTLGLVNAQAPVAAESEFETRAQTAVAMPPPHMERADMDPVVKVEAVAVPDPELPIAEQQLLALPLGSGPAAPTPEGYVHGRPEPGPRPNAPSPQDDVDRRWPALANNRVDASKSDEPERAPDLHLLLNASPPTRAELEGLGLETHSDAASVAEEAPAARAALSLMDQVMESLAAVLTAELPQRTAPLASTPPGPQQKSARADTHGATDTLTRWAERPEIMVATTHSDRVLMRLAALLTKEETPPEQHDGGQTSGIFVSTQAERVLETLAAVLPERRDERKREPMGDGWLVLDEHKLDEARGGFITDTGVRIAFGVERAVYLNGTLVTTTTLNVSELGNVSAGHSGTGASGTGNVLLLQNGQGNTFSTAAASNSTFGTVIQNTLNDQNIKSITTINATVNSLQVLRGMNLQSALRSAITGSLRK